MRSADAVQVWVHPGRVEGGALARPHDTPGSECRDGTRRWRRGEGQKWPSL